MCLLGSLCLGRLVLFRRAVSRHPVSFACPHEFLGQQCAKAGLSLGHGPQRGRVHRDDSVIRDCCPEAVDTRPSRGDNAGRRSGWIHLQWCDPAPHPVDLDHVAVLCGFPRCVLVVALRFLVSEFLAGSFELFVVPAVPGSRPWVCVVAFVGMAPAPLLSELVSV